MICMIFCKLRVQAVYSLNSLSILDKLPLSYGQICFIVLEKSDDFPQMSLYTCYASYSRSEMILPKVNRIILEFN